MEFALTATKNKARAGSYYDRIARFYDLTFKFNGYARSLDLVVTSGALEYVKLADGLNELARVIAPGGYLLHLPVHPSLIGMLLEIMFRFKSHPPRLVKDETEKQFRIVHQYHFPKPQMSGWSKTAILAQKI